MKFMRFNSIGRFIIALVLSRTRNITILAIIFLASGLILLACTGRPGIVATWISEAPANLQFQFRADGTVWLITGQDSRQIWRYELDGKDMLRLYDGIGRKQEFRFTIQNDTLTFYNPSTGTEVEKYTGGN
jgi:hypothetical protein